MLFKFPKIVWPSFHPNSKFMYKFKPCVIETLQVDYAAGGRAAFHWDPAGGVENAPAHLNISMRLIEAEFWLEGNRTDSNDPFDVYNKT
jgi:hypothetical protein